MVRQIVVYRCLDLASKLKKPDYKNFDVKRCVDFDKKNRQNADIFKSLTAVCSHGKRRLGHLLR